MIRKRAGELLPALLFTFLMTSSALASSDDCLYGYVDESGVLRVSGTRVSDQYFPLAEEDLFPIDSGMSNVWKSGSGSRPRRPIPGMDRIHGAVERCSQAYGLDTGLIHAVIEVESGYRPDAVSPKGALGLMQIMPQTGRELGLKDPFDPEQNIEAGSKYLKAMFEKYGTMQLALAAYNAGPAMVDRYQGIPPFEETRRYVEAVMDRWNGID